MSRKAPLEKRNAPFWGRERLGEAKLMRHPAGAAQEERDPSSWHSSACCSPATGICPALRGAGWLQELPKARIALPAALLLSPRSGMGWHKGW